ncbi:MAG: cellulase family glycosylhydrolase, partial [Planctomycetota bacterium]
SPAWDLFAWPLCTDLVTVPAASHAPQATAPPDGGALFFARLQDNYKLGGALPRRSTKMVSQNLLQQMIGMTLVLSLLVGCGAPAATPVPPTATPVPPTPTPVPPTATPTPNLPPITIDSGGLAVGDEPFRFVGANAVNLVFYDDWDLSAEDAIRTAKENGIIVLRLYLDWGWGKATDYDEILDIASRHGVYLLLTLTDCLPSSNSPYCDFASETSANAFKSRISEIITRRNAVNGKLYRDDTTILAWDIANEPECSRFSSSQVHDWIRKIAAHVKALDPNHLVTIGVATDSRDFDEMGPVYEMLNGPELDFFSFHFYSVPGNWDGTRPPDDHTARIAFRTKTLLSLGKPVVMEEFGFSPSGKLNLALRSNPDTVELYLRVYKESMDAAFSAGASGVMFWSWGVAGAKNVPMWWSPEDHSTGETEFSALIREYQIPVPAQP